MEGKAQERNTEPKKLKGLQDVHFLLDRLFPASKLLPLALSSSYRI